MTDLKLDLAQQVRRGEAFALEVEAGGTGNIQGGARMLVQLAVNLSGATIAAGTVVKLTSSNAAPDIVVTPATATSDHVVGVALEDILNDDTGMIVIAGGPVLILTTGTISIGSLLFPTATAGRGGPTAGTGPAFAMSHEAGSGTDTVWAHVIADGQAATAIVDGTYVWAYDGGKEVVNTVAASGATETLDLGDGNWHDVTLTADCALTLAGATAGAGCSMLILLRQDGTGGRTVTWPASVVWPGDVAPTLASDPADVTIISLLTEDGGTTWFGAYPGAGGGSVDEAAVRDAGRWEVVMDGSGVTLEPVTNEAEDDWLYHWVSG